MSNFSYRNIRLVSTYTIRDIADIVILFTIKHQIDRSLFFISFDIFSKENAKATRRIKFSSFLFFLFLRKMFYKYGVPQFSFVFAFK